VQGATNHATRWDETNLCMMNYYEWDEIIKTIWESDNPAWESDNPVEYREFKAIFIACANYLSSNDITSTWKKALWWYGCLIISPGPHLWSTDKGQLSICINTSNTHEYYNYIEAELIEYFDSVKTVRLTLNNYHSELETLIQYICLKMNLNSEGKLVVPY
jgi:hypothetical protein